VNLISDCAVEPDTLNNEAQNRVTLTGARSTSDPIGSPLGATRFCIFSRSSKLYLQASTKRIETGKPQVVINAVCPLEELKDAIKEQMAGRVHIIKVTK
jgi:hypothetical protein